MSCELKAVDVDTSSGRGSAQLHVTSIGIQQPGYDHSIDNVGVSPYSAL
jgi:hypothetical protein